MALHNELNNGVNNGVKSNFLKKFDFFFTQGNRESGKIVVERINTTGAKRGTHAAKARPHRRGKTNCTYDS